MQLRALLLLVGALACRGTEPGEVLPATVLWMEWPAEVAADQSYSLRIVVLPLCSRGELIVNQVRSADTVTFDGRYVNVRPTDWGCEPAGPIYGFTALEGSRIPGPSRRVELKASGQRFGSLIVGDVTGSNRILAAGRARFFADGPGCPRIRPAGIPSGFPPSPPSYHLVAPVPDTSQSLSSAHWVEGYLAGGATTCKQWAGDTLIFHLTADSVIQFQ